MRITLSDRKPELVKAWRTAFAKCPDVVVDLGNFFGVEADAMVSPANSFGFMDGGLDYAISERFGWQLQNRVQEYIRKRPMQELLVGEAIVVPTDDARIPWLICAPTMRVPMVVTGTLNAYLAMKALLIAAKMHKHAMGIRSMVVPGLGTGSGRLAPTAAASQMYAAYEEVILGKDTFPDSLADAQRRFIQLNSDADFSGPYA